MAQTKKKRQTKHRGNAAGTVESRGRTSRPPSPEERKRREKERLRTERMTRPPSWKISTRNSAMMAVFIVVVLLITNHKHANLLSAIIVALLFFLIAIPGGYYFERFQYRKRMKDMALGAKRS